MIEALRKHLGQVNSLLNAALMSIGLVFNADKPSSVVFDAQLNFHAPPEQRGILTRFAEMVLKHDELLNDKKIIVPQGSVPILRSQN